MDEIELLFLGSGTSAGVPMIGCHCPVCSSTDPRDKRNRASVVVAYKPLDAAWRPDAVMAEPFPGLVPWDGVVRVLVDTTPELRVQAVAQRLDRIEAVVYTHAHADHIMGLDDVRRFNVTKGGPLDIWANAETMGMLEKCFGYAFIPPSQEVKLFRPSLVKRSIDGDFQIAGMTWKPIPLIHGRVNVLGFRVGNLAYCTDVSEIPESTYALLEGLDVLVLDALQWKKHATHLTVEEALAVVERVKPKRTYFTHIAHALGHAETNAKLPAGVELAWDGLRVKASL